MIEIIFGEEYVLVVAYIRMWQNDCCQDSYEPTVYHKMTGYYLSQTQIAGLLDWVDSYSPRRNCWDVAHPAAKHI